MNKSTKAQPSVYCIRALLREGNLAIGIYCSTTDSNDY